MRILFACLAADGHFNPLTGVAMHLKDAGHDVRWYTGTSMAPRLARMGIPLYPFQRTVEITGDNVHTLFPERAKVHGPALIRFDGEKIFFSNVENYYRDIRDIDREFPFDLLFCDGAFFGARLVKQGLGKRVAVLEPGPDSYDGDPRLPPGFLGLKPARNKLQRLVYRVLKMSMNRAVDRHLLRSYNESLTRNGVDPISWPVFDDSVLVGDAAFVSGVPGFAYPRDRPKAGLEFVGVCQPWRDPSRPRGLPELARTTGRRTILISQGTVDNRDPAKLIVPALTALRGTGWRLLVATGGSGTATLRRQFSEPNIVIEDWIDFDAVLPFVDAFVCNGGSGSVLLGLTHGVPLVGAGTREGKNDNNAHVEYFGVGVNLRTEKPAPRDIRRGVAKVLVDPQFRRNAARVRDEIARFRPYDIIFARIASLVDRGDEDGAPAVGVPALAVPALAVPAPGVTAT